MLLLSGCETLSQSFGGKAAKFKNPVVGPPPRRIYNQLTDITPDEQAEAAAGVVQTGGTFSEVAAVVTADDVRARTPQIARSGEVAALVNGVPIFADEILEPVADRLAKAQAQLPPAEFRQQRREYLRQNLMPHVQRQLLIQGLKAHLKEEQLGGMNKYLDAQWDEELKRLMQQLDVTTTSEMDARLRKQNTSLAAQRDNFRDRLMAHQFVLLKTRSTGGTDRPDLLAYYQEHLADYEFPGEVKWEQILVKFADHGGKEGARKLAAQIAAELKRGADFGELAKKHSTGPTAKSGGAWDWTTQGSLADRNVEAALFELPVGAISRPLENATGIQLVRVRERKDAGRKSFADVQTEIKTLLSKADYRKSVEQLMSELLDGADVRTMFDAE